MTHGMSSSRTTIAPWLIAPPMSMTSAEASMNADAQLGSVVRHTRISSGSADPGSSTNRTESSTTPGLTGVPGHHAEQAARATAEAPGRTFAAGG